MLCADAAKWKGGQGRNGRRGGPLSGWGGIEAALGLVRAGNGFETTGVDGDLEEAGAGREGASKSNPHLNAITQESIYSRYKD